jgi:hypothetical protein
MIELSKKRAWREAICITCVCTTRRTAVGKVGNKSSLGLSVQSCSYQPQRARWAHRYLSTLLQAAACQVLLTAHVLRVAFRRSCRLRGETAGMYPFYPKSTFRGCSLDLCHLGFFSSPPSSLQICIVADKQGGIRGESATALAEQATARLTTRFSASETDVLGERGL